MLLKFRNKTALYELRPRKRLPVIKNKLGVVTQDLITPMQRSLDVQACKLNDAPKFGSKDGPILVQDAWVLYMKKLMTPHAWWWWIGMENMLFINKKSKWGSAPADVMPVFELIVCPCNFIEVDKIYNGHARVISRNSANYPVNTLDPQKDNWFYTPTMFHKATMHNSAGDVFLVGQSDHVYSPVMRRNPECWIETHRVEWFPPLPMSVTYQGKQYTITGYCLLGASVYGHADEMDIPLRLARVPGELIHPCPEWILKEKPVPVEVRAEWTYVSN